MRIIIAKLIWEFDIEDKGEQYAWEDQKTFHMWEKEPLVVGLTPAKH
jgi:hypothetical protein